ncbi:MAG: FtsX-like permease family protein [Gammaproteobacteria bacterium]|nr:FtsX-like permease family protein [Gammaproteobacteria bacterium]
MQETVSAIRLALADFVFEWRLSSCFVLALAAVLAPLLVLFGLKYGIVETIRGPMLDNPLYRQISPIGSGHFPHQWFEQMRAHPAVDFVVPRTRNIAATIELRVTGTKRIALSAELIPTAPGDPALASPLPGGNIQQVILSAAAARKLQVNTGDSIEGVVERSRHGRRQRATATLEVTGIAPERAFGRPGVFAAVAFLDAVEDYRDGHAAPALGWSGSRAPERQFYASYRLYAKHLQDVAVLRDGLQAAGLNVRTRAADIEVLQSLDRNLSLIFWVLAAIGAVGYLLSLGASLWSLVERKRKELSVMRLMGIRTGALVWFPVAHAVLLAIAGSALAVAAAIGIAVLLNSLFADVSGAGQFVCRLLPTHLVSAVGITLLGATLACVLAAYRSTRIDPAEGLRDV